MNKSLLFFAIVLSLLLVSEAVPFQRQRGPPKAQNIISRQTDLACQQSCTDPETKQDCIHQCLSPVCFEESKKMTELHEKLHAFKTCYAEERVGIPKNPLL